MELIELNLALENHYGMCQSRVCTMVTSTFGGEKVKPLAIRSGKVSYEIEPGPFWIWALAPVADGIGQDSRFVKHGDGFANGGALGDWIMAGSCKAAAFLCINPNGRNGVQRIPLAIQLHGIGFQVIGLDFAIGGMAWK
jgi:hypothetical protein